MAQITPEDFWVRYREECRSTGTRQSLRKDPSWTKIAIEAAKTVCRRAELEIGHELYLDVMGYEQRRKGVPYNWDLRVAFEHENNPETWQDELCKLCHVAANLCVLASYFFRWDGLEKLLQDRIDLMGERTNIVRGREWLFIFGPRESEELDKPWVAYKLDESRRLKSLPNERPFNPYRDLK